MTVREHVSLRSDVVADGQAEGISTIDEIDGTNAATTKALMRKRADLLFEIVQSEKHTERLRLELVHLDAVLRMFLPEASETDMPMRQRRWRRSSPYFARGELTQRIYAALRQRTFIASADIAADAMRNKGLDPEASPAIRTDFGRRVTAQPSALAREGKVKRVGKGRAMRWRLPAIDH
jgi:hypothetical protein